MVKGRTGHVFKGRIKKAIIYLFFLGGIVGGAILASWGLCRPNSPFEDACQVSSGVSLWVAAALGAVTTLLFFWMIESKTSEISATVLRYDQKRAYAAGYGSAEFAEMASRVKQDETNPAYIGAWPEPLGHRFRRAYREQKLRDFLEVCESLGMQFDPKVIQMMISDPEAGKAAYLAELDRKIRFRLREDLAAYFRFGQIASTMDLVSGTQTDTWLAEALKHLERLVPRIGEETKLYRTLPRVVKLTRMLTKATSQEDKEKLIDAIKREIEVPRSWTWD